MLREVDLHSRFRNRELTKEDTLFLKGIALVLLLAHHLFYEQTGFYADFRGVVHEIGLFSKLCVAIFVFLSGYGIVKSARGKMQTKTFYAKGFTKLYMNYWLMWVLFVIPGVFLLGRTLQVAYGSECVGLKLLIDLWGFADSAGFASYNITWWFYSCILLLYLLAPLLYRLIRRYPLWVMGFAALFMEFYTPRLLFGSIRYYLFPFVLGMVCAHNDWISGLAEQTKRHPMAAAVLFVVLILLRCLIGLKVDGLVAAALAVATVAWCWNRGVVGRLFRFLGEHSFNIFLFHTFIYYYYFEELVFWSRNPVVILFTLLGLSVLLSVGIEKLKRWIGYYELQKRITNLVTR